MPASCIKDVAEVGGDVPTIKECRIKNNLPITLTERFPDAAKPIVTKTDLQGRITYANESFVAISGFGREELIGESHNIVRHPDMPKAAFADLWRIIKADQPWRGIVKNRCKNGDYYWVDAYVTPVTENGRTTGYMSVRTPPSRTDVAATEALYRQVQSGSATLPATEFPASMARADLAFWLVAIGSGGLALAGAALGGTTGFACAVAAAAVGLAQAPLVRTRFVNPLRELDAIIRAIDEGQLGRRISARGAVAPTFVRLEALRIHLRAIFADVLVSSREVDARARAMDEAMQALVSGAEVQMDRIQQVAAAMQQMSASIDEISSSTAAGMDAAIRTESAAKAGIVGIETCIDSSRRVADVVADSKEKIGDVNAAVARISDISRVIKEIAAQTNLLALNAAIEAARAGDQGRGFAVVADEVRKLAESTESSIGEISGVVGTVAESSGTAAATMVKVAKEVDQSASLVADNGETLKMIWQNSQAVARSSREIADMLSQQTSTTHEIALNMERISTAVEAGNGNVAKVGQTARRLRETSENLRLLVAHMESAIS